MSISLGNDHQNTSKADGDWADDASTSGKIPQISLRRPTTVECCDEDGDKTEDQLDDLQADKPMEGSRTDKSPVILADSSLEPNHIRTRSVPSSSPLRFSFSLGRPSNLSISATNVNEGDDDNKEKAKSRLMIPPHSHHVSTQQGSKVSRTQSKSHRLPSNSNPGLESSHAAFAKEMQSPRFQAVLRVTSGRKKKPRDIKSFSHELSSKGVRPFKVWKSCAFRHMEEIMVAIREKFDGLKEEVNVDLGVYAGDLVTTLENRAESDIELEVGLGDLLVVTRQCVEMPASEFWVKCEAIVQKLDDKRQELPMGILKQAHTRLLFILTRCTRLLQFKKESGHNEEHIMGRHQMRDFGVYPEKMQQITQQENWGGEKGTNEMLMDPWLVKHSFTDAGKFQNAAGQLWKHRQRR